MINEAQKVERYFGYWPQFCDGRIERFTYEQAGGRRVIELSIDYIDSDKALAATVVLQFSGVSELELSELMSVNVLDALHIAEGDPVQVTLESAYGLTGAFRCKEVSVIAIRPTVMDATKG